MGVAPVCQRQLAFLVYTTVSNQGDHWAWKVMENPGKSLQPAGTVTTNSGMHSYVMFRLFQEKYSADGL